jgi:hypothetical protein
VNQKEGFAYVAISRVKALSGILFESAFNFDQFKRVDPVTIFEVYRGINF